MGGVGDLWASQDVKLASEARKGEELKKGSDKN